MIEYNLCTNSHVQSLGVNTTEDLDSGTFFVFVAGVIPTQKEKKYENGNDFLDKNHLHYFQVKTGMAVAGVKTCDFVTYTSKGIFIVTITCNDKFWATVVATVYKFYCQQIVPSFLMEALPSDNFHTKQLSQRQEDQQIQ